MGTARRFFVGAGKSLAIGLVLVAGLFALLHQVTDRSTAGPAPKPSVTSPPSPAWVLKTNPPLAKRRIPHVPQAPPTRLYIPNLGVNAAVGQLAITTVDGQAGLNPPEATLAQLTTAYWWNQRQAPGNPTEGTTFIIGHSCRATDCPAVFNRLQDIGDNAKLVRRVHRGDTVTSWYRDGPKIVVETPAGILTYRVYKTMTIPRPEVAGNPVINADHKQGLLVMACKLRKDGGVQQDNFAAWAKLVGAKKA